MRVGVLVAAGMAAILAAAAPANAQSQSPGLLFHYSADRGLNADVAAGGIAAPVFADQVSTKPGGQGGGNYLEAATDQVLAWQAPGNIYAQRGTLSFFWRAREPLGATEFPIFRVGYADHSSWDMAFLRIDWNGHGFDAFVTDTGLARERVSYRVAQIPAADRWLHLAFTWDETVGVRLYVDGVAVGQVNQRAVLDSGLSFFGPHSRIISAYQVQSQYNFRRGGDVDELRVYDRMLEPAQIAQLARNQAPQLTALAPRNMSAGAAMQEWRMRHGWTGAAPPVLASNETRIRRLEFSDARDVRQWMWKGNDGIRETTWPGVYNRSRLAGRSDYFILPDWNVYSFGGRRVTYWLPDEPWNRLEVQGPAAGRFSYMTGTSESAAAMGRRPAGVDRTTHVFGERRGGAVRFDNDAAETPINEIGAYNVSAGAPPAGIAQLRYVVRAGVSSDMPELDDLTRFIAGRYVADERSIAVAAPATAPGQAPRAPEAANAAPIVHVLIPYDVSGARDARAYQRFSYTWNNINAGLDGVVLEIPALNVRATHGGLYPLNIRVKDPIWPARDLLDINVSVRPGEARTIFLDTRDRILPADRSLYFTIAGAGPGLTPAALDGMGVRLVFKDRAEAAREHVHDRFQQIRDNYGFIVEENPTSPRLPLMDRLNREITDLLRVQPDHANALAYWAAISPERPLPRVELQPVPQGTPAWAARQVEVLGLVRQFLKWWIDERQVDGEFGGGLSDDTDFTNQFPPLALMGVEPDTVAASHRAMMEAVYRNGMFTDGLSTITTDELHSYEEGINGVAQAMYMDWGEPIVVERLMATAKRYADLTEVNSAGHRHVISNYFGAHHFAREGIWEWSRASSYLIFHPGLMLVEFNGNPRTRQLILDLADGYLAHGREANGAWTFPSEINWRTDQARGANTDRMHQILWAAYRWTGDAKYLRPLEADIARAGPGVLNQITGDAPTITGHREWVAPLVANAASGSNDSYSIYQGWQTNSDPAPFERLFAGQAQRYRARMFVVTEGHMWSDRVELSSQDLQRTRLGGVALVRNGIFPGHAVSWRFAAPAKAEDVALLVAQASPERMIVTAYNLSDRPVQATMTGWNVAAGTWGVRQSVDVGGDRRHVPEGVVSEASFGPSESISFTLAPRQTTTIELSRRSPATPLHQRSDIGIGRGDVAVQGSSLTVTVHSLGSVAAPAGRLIVEDANGREIASAATPALEAPLDLTPKTAQVRIALPGGFQRAGARVRLELATPEITRMNNVFVLN